MASPLELKITRYLNGDALVDTLNGSEITLKHTYNPKPGDGESDISETVNLVFEGAQATVQSTINSINRYLADVRKRQANGYGDRVYLEARAGTAAEWRRSEILDGRLSITDEGMQDGLTSNDRTPATLAITRRGWWENTAGTYLPVYNSNGTAAVDGSTAINVYNCADGAGTVPNKRENWLKVATADISGDLPSPVTTWVYDKSTAGAQALITGGMTSYCGTAALVMSNYYYDFNTTADASCSGGSYTAGTISASGSTLLFNAYFGEQYGNATKQLGGAPYHVVARFRDTSSLGNVRFKIKVRDQSSSTVIAWEGPWVTFSQPTVLTQDMGVVNLPPGLSTDWIGMTMEIYGERLTANTETINIDYIQLIGGDCMKIYGAAWPRFATRYKFGGANEVYTRYSGGDITAPANDLVGVGAPSLTVEPDIENAFVFAFCGTATAINPRNEVSVAYRPRWSSPL